MDSQIILKLDKCHKHLDMEGYSIFGEPHKDQMQVIKVTKQMKISFMVFVFYNLAYASKGFM